MGGVNAPTAGKNKDRRRRYCRPRPLCCRVAALHDQKPSENGRNIPIFDGEARNTAHALGSEACGDHILQRHTSSSNSHCVPIVSGKTFFYQNSKKPAWVSSLRATTFDGISKWLRPVSLPQSSQRTLSLGIRSQLFLLCIWCAIDFVMLSRSEASLIHQREMLRCGSA